MLKLSIRLAIFIVAITQIAANPIVQPGLGIYGDNFQGDIKLSEWQKKVFFGGAEEIDPNTGWTHPSFRWPTNANGHVIMPYRIQASEGYRKFTS